MLCPCPREWLAALAVLRLCGELSYRGREIVGVSHAWALPRSFDVIVRSRGEGYCDCPRPQRFVDLREECGAPASSKQLLQASESFLFYLSLPQVSHTTKAGGSTALCVRCSRSDACAGTGRLQSVHRARQQLHRSLPGGEDVVYERRLLVQDPTWDDGITGNQAGRETFKRRTVGLCSLRYDSKRLICIAPDGELRCLLGAAGSGALRRGSALVGCPAGGPAVAARLGRLRPQVPAVVYNRGDEAVGMLPRPRANLQILRQANDGREDQAGSLELLANIALEGLSQAHLRELLQPFRGTRANDIHLILC